MPWPDFSELTFGYSFLREFERLYTAGGYFPAAPDFISQAQEATEGYDVKVALTHGAPVFFQFKRSFIVRSRAAAEFKVGAYFAEPIVYRMNLMKKMKYRQHAALQRLESKGHNVYYVTSQVDSPSELSKYFVKNKIVSAATAMFAPSDIQLPDFTKPHHVSFKADADHGWLFSEEGKRFDRSAHSIEALTEKLAEDRLAEKENRNRLARFIRILSEEFPGATRFAPRVTDTVARASILAAAFLDAQMTVFNGPQPIKLALRLSQRDVPIKRDSGS